MTKNRPKINLKSVKSSNNRFLQSYDQFQVLGIIFFESIILSLTVLSGPGQMTTNPPSIVKWGWRRQGYTMTGPNATDSRHKDGNNQGKSHWQTPLIAS